ncbi:hypothetical protein CH341_31945, partial [Rhodoplanes roseus]
IDAAAAERMAESRENSDFLPGPRLPETIAVTSDMARLGDADCVLLVVPSQATRSLLTGIGATLSEDAVVVACAKGIEQETGALQGEIVRAALPEHQ